MAKKIINICMACLAAASFSGCVGELFTPREDPTQFYVLTEKVGPETVDGISEQPVNISLVRVPAYMTRSQIVSLENDSSRIYISDINRWPETPIDSFTRVLSSNLARIAKNTEIHTYPSLAMGIGAVDLRVSVLECMGRMGGELEFRARWEITKSKDANVVKRESKIFETKVKTKDSYDSYVAAISEALYELSLDIAKGLKEFK